MMQKQIDGHDFAASLAEVGIGLVETEEGIRIVVINKPWLSMNLELPNDIKNRLMELMHDVSLLKDNESKEIQQWFIVLNVAALYLATKDGKFPMESFIAVLSRLGKVERVSDEEVERIFGRRNQTGDGYAV